MTFASLRGGGCLPIFNYIDGAADELWIGCQESHLAAVLPPIIRRFSEDNPQVSLHVHDVPSPVVQLAELRNRKYDFVLARIVRLLVDEDVNVETLFNDQVVIAAGARSWLRRRKIDLAELVDKPWMLTPPDTWVYSRLAEAFATRGLNMPRANVLTVSVPLRNHLLADSPLLRLCELGTAAQRRTIRSHGIISRFAATAVARCRSDTSSPLVERFIECARDVVKSISGNSRGNAGCRRRPNVF